VGFNLMFNLLYRGYNGT